MRLWRKRKYTGFLPVFFASMAATFWSSVIKTLIVLAVPVAALMWFGQPALLFEYWSHGPASYRIYDKCDYIALDGRHTVIPGWRGASADCPTIKLVPADIRKLLWG